jgi:thioredoxin-dependent peroxiredoxin
VSSHERFHAELALPFPLLADSDEKLCKAYGTLYERTDEHGAKSVALQRSTFLIDPKGIVRHVWPKVSVPGHAADVLDTLRMMSAKMS